MEEKELFGKLKKAVIDGDSEELMSLVKGAIEKVDPLAIVEEGMMPGMTEVGNDFSEGRAYLPELLMAAEAWDEAMKLIKPKLLEAGLKVVDFSADYRIKNAKIYEQFYQVKHTDTDNLAKAVFGLFVAPVRG